MRRFSAYIFVIQLICSLAFAQLSTLPAAKAIEELPGPPKNPPIFSTATALFQGGLQYADVVNVKGHVAKVVREEDQTPENNPDRFHKKSVLTFDENGNLIERSDQDPNEVATTTLHWVHGRLESMRTKYHRNDGKMLDREEWEKWSYDDRDRLSEFRAGRDKEEMNSFINFRYDEKDRPLGYEEATSLVDISYTGDTITLSKLEKGNHHKFFEQVQRVDEKNRVRDLKVSDMSGGHLKLWYHVAFKYDSEGRVIEQDTDPFDLAEGDDYSPLPGKVLVSYDDKRQNGEQKYYDPQGRLGLHTRFDFDRDGIPVKFHFLDASGKERVGSELFIDSAKKVIQRPGDVEWQVLYDDHGNWIERRRWFTPADGSPRVMTRVVRQSITYR